MNVQVTHKGITMIDNNLNDINFTHKVCYSVIKTFLDTSLLN